MDTIKFENVEIGEGRPAVCVPITGHDDEEIKLRAAEAAASGADLAEWRADWYDCSGNAEKLIRVLSEIKSILPGMPLLVTFRTAAEGGEQDIDADGYRNFLESVITSGLAHLVDVELFMGEELLKHVCRTAHEHGVYVVASSHDFKKTPPEDEIIRRLKAMQECGADILKIAVMPESVSDVLTLLSATSRMKEKYASKPLVTMSMGRLGMISRLSGEVFGSALTFGSAGTASAPGQIGVEELCTVLDTIHKNF